MNPTDPLRTVSLPLRQLDQILPYSRDETGFLYWPDAWGTPALGIESERLSECVDEVNRRGLKGVFASGRFFQDDDLDFLTQLPKTEMVEFWDTPMQDVSGLHGLNGLRYLRLSCKRPAMDYSEIAPLTHLVLEHKARDRNLGSQESLEDLRVWRFKPKSGDFRSLQLPERLSELGIYFFNGSSLDGLANLQALKKLTIERCRNLESIAQLAESCPNLEHLAIIDCPRVTSELGEALATSLPKIDHLYAGNTRIR